MVRRSLLAGFLVPSILHVWDRRAPQRRGPRRRSTSCGRPVWRLRTTPARPPRDSYILRLSCGKRHGKVSTVRCDRCRGAGPSFASLPHTGPRRSPYTVRAAHLEATYPRPLPQCTAVVSSRPPVGHAGCAAASQAAASPVAPSPWPVGLDVLAWSMAVHKIRTVALDQRGDMEEPGTRERVIVGIWVMDALLTRTLEQPYR